MTPIRTPPRPFRARRLLACVQPLGVALLLSMTFPSVHAAVIEAWVHRYNGPANGSDYATAVAVDGNGNAAVTGYSPNGDYPDYYTAKYAAADGALLWEQRYNAANGVDAANAVAVDGSGNVVVTGTSRGSAGSDDYYTAKYAAADGALLWERRYPTRVGGPEVFAVVADGDGNVVVAGSSGTIKYLANGTAVWTNSGFIRAVGVDGSDNVVVTGFFYNGTNADYYTAKYAAADGALLWEKRYNSPANGNDFAATVAVDGSGNVVVTGHAGEFPGDYYTAKYAAADGTLLWEKSYNRPANRIDLAKAVAVDGSGNVVVTGYSSNGTNNDYYTARYAAANGALLWEKRYNGPANSDDQAQAVAVDGSGNVVVTGNSYNGTNYDYYTAKWRQKPAGFDTNTANTKPAGAEP